MVRTHPETPFVPTYWDWMSAGSLHVPVALQLDQLTAALTRHANDQLASRDLAPRQRDGPGLER